MIRPTFSVAALVSAGRHPVSDAPRACRGDAVAVAVARHLAGDAARVVYAGTSKEGSLFDYLALGAGKIDVLEIESGENPIPALAKHLADVDIIVTGSRAEIGEGSGLVPYALAHALDRPIVANVLEARVDRSAAQGWIVNLRQFLPKGKRRNIEAPLPLVLAVHALAPATLSYAFARSISGRIESHRLETSPKDRANRQWSTVSATWRPIVLKAQTKKAGHARMLSAIVAETKGGVVAFEGSSVDKAQVVLNYLREHRLIDF